VNGEWRDNECSEEIKQSVQYASYELNKLKPDTVYKIELRAHNTIGSSSPAQIRVKTARGEHREYYSYDTYSSGTVRVASAGLFPLFVSISRILFS
jgi:hypothetical protein